MGVINRGVVIVRPKEPFLEWLRGLPGPGGDATLEELRRDCNAYLIPEWETPEELDHRLKEHCRDIFEEELRAWWLGEEDWPAKRTWSVFRAWFDIECIEMVKNVVEEPMLDDETDG